MNLKSENISYKDANNYLYQELELVLGCAGSVIGLDKKDRIKELLKNDIDWNLVVEMAKYHGLLFFLYRNLKRICPEFVPEQVLSMLKILYFNNSTRNLALSADLVGILSLFEAHGICAVPHKGPVLAASVYGDIGLRSFSDLDILVKKQDAIKARNLLFQYGFYTDQKINEAQLLQYLKFENFFKLTSKNKRIHIDLHWELTGKYCLKPIFFENISDQLIKIDLSGKKINSLCYEDMLLHLCIHGARHSWSKIEHICSIAEIIKSGKIKNWGTLEKRAAQFKCKTIVCLGIYLSAILFKTTLPHELEEKIINRSGLTKLADQIIYKLLSRNQAGLKQGNWRFVTMHFRVRDSFSDMSAYALKVLFEPTAEDWKTIQMPSAFLFLYYIIRPARLFKDFLTNFSM